MFLDAITEHTTDITCIVANSTGSMVALQDADCAIWVYVLGNHNRFESVSIPQDNIHCLDFQIIVLLSSQTSTIQKCFSAPDFGHFVGRMQ